MDLRLFGCLIMITFFLIMLSRIKMPLTEKADNLLSKVMTGSLMTFFIIPLIGQLIKSFNLYTDFGNTVLVILFGIDSSLLVAIGIWGLYQMFKSHFKLIKKS